MGVIQNEIVISAPIEKIWEALSEIETLDKYDPTVKKSTAISQNTKGAGAKRKVDMKDGKNWFEDHCTVWKPYEEIVYELTACSFPVRQLKHSYSFEKVGDQIRVKQVMHYKMKFGLFGKLLDVLLIRKRSDAGIKKFFAGLKSYSESDRKEDSNGI